MFKCLKKLFGKGDRSETTNTEKKGSAYPDREGAGEGDNSIRVYGCEIISIEVEDEQPH